MLNQKWYQATELEMEFHMVNMMYEAFSAEHILYSVSLGDALTTAAVRPFLALRQLF